MLTIVADSLLFNQQPQDGALVKGKQRATNGDVLALDMAAAEEGQGGGDFMQMQLMEQQVSPIACPEEPGLISHRTTTSNPVRPTSNP